MITTLPPAAGGGGVITERHADLARARALLDLTEALGDGAAGLDGEGGLLAQAAERAGVLLGDAAAIWVIEPPSIALRAFSHRDPAARAFMAQVTAGVQHAPDGLVASLIAGGESLRVTGDEVDALLPMMEPQYRDYFSRYGVAGMVIVPLRSRDRHVGALGVSRDRSGAPFSDADVEFVNQVARVVSLAVANATLLAEVGEAQRRAQALSWEDDLTGLLNRRGFLDVLRSRLRAPNRGSALVAVLDMDGFKLVNDGFGHAAGDMVLASTAARLCAALPPGTPVARIGGDEFAVLVEAADDERAAAVLEQAVLDSSGPVSVVGLSVPMTLSVGTAVPGQDGAEEVLLQADLAMYRAKRRGAIVAAYDPGLDDPATRRLREVLELRRVITAGELVVHYQAVVPVGEGPLRLEALVRREVDGRLVPPSGWLQTAARAGLMRELTDSVLGKVVDQLARWWTAGLEVEVAVNVPAPVLALPEVVGTLLSRLDAAGLPRRALSVEVTEGDLVGPQARAALTRCADADIGVAVDDFGTGWSALSYLVDLPLRTLKVDRTFVEGCDVDPRRAAVVGAVVEVAHELGLHVVAEGVETTAVADALIALGADALQGYLYSRPQPAEAVEALLRSGLSARHSSAVRS